MPQQTEGEVCPACNGVGYKVVEQDGLSYAGACDCRAERLKAANSLRASIPERFQHTTFENFKTGYDGNPVVGNLLSKSIIAARGWARDYPMGMFTGQRRGLLFLGEPGCGKTHLAVSALKQVLAMGFGGAFYDYRTLLAQVARGWNTDSGTEERQAFRRAVDMDILLIDDLGAQRNMEWAEDIITEIITERYNSMKAVIVTTNLPLNPKPLPALPNGGFVRMSRALGEVIGERSRSRLIEMCKVIDMSGVDDYRERHAKEW